jgi:uncharacterized protein DUF6603
VTAPSNGDTVALLTEELAAIVEPLVSALSSPAAAADFLADVGLSPGAVPQPLLDLLPAVTDLLATVADGVDVGDVPVAAAKLRQLITAIEGLSSTGLGATAPRELLEHLLAHHLLAHRPRLAHALRLLGLLTAEQVPATATRPAHTRIALPLDRVAALVTDPRGTIAAAWRWGQEPLAADLLFDAGTRLAESFGIEPRLSQVPPPLAALFASGNADVDDRYMQLLRWLVLHSEDQQGLFARVGLTIAPVPPVGGAGGAGVAVLGFASASFAEGVALTENVSLVIEADAAVDGGPGLVLRPAAPVEIRAGLGAGAAAATAALSIGIEHRRPDGAPIVLVGEAGGSRIEYGSLTVVAGARLGAGDRPSAFLEARLAGSAIVIKPGADADSFLSALLPADGFRLEFNLDAVLDSVTGLSFSGAAGLEIRYPTHVAVGPLTVEGLTLALRPAGNALALDAGADVTGHLGPLAAAVQNVGLTARLDPDAAQRNLGLVDLALTFKPPTGVGLAIDAGVVSGGGFLFLDHAKGEYAGVLEVSISGIVSVTAIGLITTRQPDGSPGFSLLLILTAEFFPGLQLGFGFALIGVGGLIGLHRSVRLDTLAERISTGAAQSVLFPRDVVANAPRILSDLRAIFPPKQGTLLVGPMAKIGWGTPTLVSLSLGVIIEIPGNIAILGVLQVALPTEDAALVLLRVSFIGAIEFDRQRVWFFASLTGSRVLVFPIDGELGLLMAFGEDATFVLSVGGFHPRFTPPPLPFPAPARIGITILQTPVARITAQGYLAVTSNTVQFGARADLKLGFGGFGLTGHIAFDALFRFSPFSFEIDVSASMSLQAFGVGVFTVRIELTLSGPAPWRARGRGSISLFFFDISADFDITWGEAQNTLVPPVAVLGLLTAEFAKPEAWTAERPDGRPLLVALRRLDASELVLHPLGALRVSQRAVPLGVRLDKVGAGRPSDVRRVVLEAAAAGLSVRGPATEQFAMAQFQDMTDEERLSRRAFEPQNGGVLLAGTAALATSRTVRRTVRYEQILLDTFYRRPPSFLLVLHTLLFRQGLAGSAAVLSALSGARERAQQPFAEKIAVRPGGFVVASTATNAPVAAEARFDSETQAAEFLAARPGLAGSAHVIPAFEAV